MSTKCLANLGVKFSYFFAHYYCNHIDHIVRDLERITMYYEQTQE